jgi:TonB family protein
LQFEFRKDLIMAGALLYQSRQSWRVGAAFGAAALIHFAAVALASIHRHEQAGELSPRDDGFPPIDLVTEFATDKSPPPPDVAALPLTPNPIDESFPDERPSPPPIRRQDHRLVAPTANVRTGTAGSLTLPAAKVLALSAPRPEYPYEARRQKITGDGIVAMTVDPVTGSVTDVAMWKSTGSLVLDNAAVTAFRRWRFKPGAVSRVKSPITFTMTGAAY